MESPAFSDTPIASRVIVDPKTSPETGDRSAFAPLAPAPLKIVDVGLNEDTFRALKDKGARVPEYDRAALRPGIVALGGTSRLAGGLVYDLIEDYLNANKNDPDKQKWGVVVVGFSPHSKSGPPSTIDSLQDQDGLYILAKKGMDHKGAVTTDLRVVGCVKETLQAKDDQSAVIAHIASPDIRLVTMSILSKNYCLNKDGTGIDFGLPQAQDLVHDLKDPRSPHSSLGILVEGLRQRMLQNPDASITVLCCDNLPAPSGSRVKSAILSYAEQLEDPSGERPLYKWIRDNVHIPSVMVDRIVPVPDEEATGLVRKMTGYADKRTLVTEPDEARCIVIQKNERNGAAFMADNPFQDVQGVIFAGEDAPLYGIVKEAMVNADHVFSTLIGEFFLDGPNIHEVVGHPELKNLRRSFVDQELIPSITPHVPVSLDIEHYRDVVHKRFANAGLPDPVKRISDEIYGRIPRILKIIDRLTASSIGNDDDMLAIDRTCDAVASWVISRVHGRVAYGREVAPVETDATKQKIAEAKELSGYQRDLESRGLEYAIQAVFLQMCDMKMFGDTSDNKAFQDATLRSLSRFSRYVESEKPQ